MRKLLVLVLLGLATATAGCGVHVVQSRAFTIAGVASIENDVAGRQNELGEQRLANARVRIIGPRLEGTGVAEVASGFTDPSGRFAISIPHGQVAARSSAVYPWAAEIPARIFVGDVGREVRFSAAFDPRGNPLVQRSVNVASTIVARNLQPWLRVGLNAQPAQQESQSVLVFAQTLSPPGSNQAIQELEGDVAAILADPPAGVPPVGLSALLSLKGAVSAVCGALADTISLVADGAEVATSSRPGTLALAPGGAVTLGVRAARSGKAIGLAIEVTNSDDPVSGPTAPATVVGLEQEGASAVKLTARRAGAARIQARIGGVEDGAVAELRVTVTP